MKKTETEKIMLQDGCVRGFSPEWMAKHKESKIGEDDKGFYIFTLSQNVKVYLDDFYIFLEKLEAKCLKEAFLLERKIQNTPGRYEESLAYYRARKTIVDLILRNITTFYADNQNLGVIMTPWCFGTVILEKVEIYTEKLARGDIYDSNIPEYPYFVLKYINEIYKKTLLELFEFPQEAFAVRWQYTELLKRYSKVLSSVTASLQSLLYLVKNSTER